MYPNDGIVAFSHVAIPVRPDNPHYGRRGTYKSCLEYEKSNEERAADQQACRTEDDSRETSAPTTGGAVAARASLPPTVSASARPPPSRSQTLEAASTLKGLEPPLVLRRLTFNPDFDGMLAEIDAFVERVQEDAR